MADPRGMLISGNWKMHVNHYEAIRLVQELAALFRAEVIPLETTVSVHPPFTSLRTVQTALESDGVPVVLGAQNCHYADRGAFTGEVSAEMLSKLNVSYVIVGHSERRQYFGETDADVHAKLDAVLRNQMTPIVCVGESIDERERGEAFSCVGAQLSGALGGRSGEEIGRLVVAYEPIWAIGGGAPATVEDAQEMCAAIRDELIRIGGPPAANARIQYGGSVNEENAAAFLGEPDVDGLLVGGASLDAGRFSLIVGASG